MHHIVEWSNTREISSALITYDVNHVILFILWRILNAFGARGEKKMAIFSLWPELPADVISCKQIKVIFQKEMRFVTKWE